MKPNDENGKLPTDQRPFLVPIISGYPPAGMLPAKQKKLSLNQDFTLAPKKSEGGKLGED